MGSAPAEHADHLHRREDGPAGIWTVEHLVEHLREHVSQSMALVCVGNELCGDDGAGVAVAKSLSEKVPWDVYDTQTVPESFLMKIVARQPDPVILVDALHFGADPGAIELIDPASVAGRTPSTHGPAPLGFLEVLEMFHPCRRLVLGIQPKQVEFGQPMSEPVRAGVGRIVRAFQILAEEFTTRPR